MRKFYVHSLFLITSINLLAQAPTAPPMKLGLWQAETTSRASGSATPDGKVLKRTVLSCVTKNNWLTLMGPTAKNSCPKTNEAWTAQSYRFDLQCSGRPKMGSVAVFFDDAEHQHVIVDMASTPGGTPTNLQMNGQSHWISSDCGTLSESNPVMVKGAGN